MMKVRGVTLAAALLLAGGISVLAFDDEDKPSSPEAKAAAAAIQKLADDAGAESSGRRAGFDGVALAQNVRSRQEVDEIVGAAERAGGRVTRPPGETSYGGYAGYFADPDGHLWEVAYNPGFSLADDGTLTLPDFGAS